MGEAVQKPRDAVLGVIAVDKPHWYVVQVETGREQKACEAILRACEQEDSQAEGDVPVVREVFSPRYQSRFKLHGKWHDEERQLLPGYVVAVTAEPARLARVLRGVLGFTRILTTGETFAPLKEEDRGWIERWTKEGDRTIPMSIAYKEGDSVVVTSGPLAGREGLIKKIKRRQCVAEIEIHTGAITIRTTIGLAVLPSKPEERKD